MKIEQNQRVLQELLGEEWLNALRIGAKEQALLKDAAAANRVELRPVRRGGHPPKVPNDIVWLPRYAQQLANPFVVGVARRVLDDHLRRRRETGWDAGRIRRRSPKGKAQRARMAHGLAA